MLYRYARTIRTKNLHRLMQRAVLTLLFLTVLTNQDSLTVAAGLQPSIRSSGSALIIDGQPGVYIPGKSGSLRAANAATLLIGTGERSVKSIAMGRGRFAVATGKGKIILVVTWQDALLHRCSPSELSIEWSSQINHLLATQPIQIVGVQKTLFISTGSYKYLKIGGSASADDIAASSTANAIARASFDEYTRRLTVQAMSAGICSIEVTAEDGNGNSALVSLPTVVKDHAAAIDPEIDTTVTGTPCAPADVVLQAARTALTRAVRLNPLAVLNVISMSKITDALYSGDNLTLHATVRATGPNLVPEQQTVTIQIHNDTTFKTVPADALYYSNNPETVKEPQTLFCAYVSSVGKPVRLVFHHQNCTASPMLFRVELLNTSSAAIRIHYVRGISVPLSDPVAAGARAAADFLRNWRASAGLYLDIPAKTRLELSASSAQPNEVSSGVADIEQMTGKSQTLLLRVCGEKLDAGINDGMRALDALSDPETTALQQITLSGDFQTKIAAEAKSDQIYSTPYVFTNGNYAVGDEWLHINIGTKNALAKADGNGICLAGNYGVVYIVSLTLTNPTASVRTVVVNFESDAGPVSGVFNINDTVFAAVNNLFPPNEQELTRTQLPPGSTRKLQIMTIPESGSAYPASITAHAI